MSVWNLSKTRLISTWSPGAGADEAESNGEEAACREPDNAQVLAEDSEPEECVRYLIHLHTVCSLSFFFSLSPPVGAVSVLAFPEYWMV